MPSAIVFATLTVAGLLTAVEPLIVVRNLDPERYAGRWFEIARLPNRFQAKCAGDVTADYQLRPQGGFTVVNRCRDNEGKVTTASGVARLVAGQPPSVLQVRFAPAWLSLLPFVWGGYQVIALDDAHTYSMVGTVDRKYLWILSRTPLMDPDRYERLLSMAKGQGFEVSLLVTTSHIR